MLTTASSARYSSAQLKKIGTMNDFPSAFLNKSLKSISNFIL